MDEAKVQVDGNGIAWVSRTKAEAYLPECVVPKLKGKVGGVLLFAGVWHGGRTDLVRFDTSQSQGKRKGVTAAIYRDQITMGPLKSAWNRVNNRWRGYGGARLLEDNVGIHKSPVNREQGKRQGFTYLNHPPYSPDLNPIENLWAMLKSRLHKLERKPTNEEELFETLQELWWGIEQEKIDAVIDSMPRRLAAVRRVRGFVTKN